jgi:predicted nucleotidyltransferase
MGFLRRVISINHRGRRENAEGAEKNTEGAEEKTVLKDYFPNNNAPPFFNFASCRSMNYQELQWI